MAIFTASSNYKFQYNLRALFTKSVISLSNSKALAIYISTVVLLSLAFAFLSITVYRNGFAGWLVKSLLIIFLLGTAITHTRIYFKRIPLSNSGWRPSVFFFSLLAFVAVTVLFLVFLLFQKELLLLSINGLLFLLPVVMIKTWNAFDNISENEFPVYKLEADEERDVKVYLNTLSIGIKILIDGPELYERTFYTNLPEQLPLGHLFSMFMQYEDYDADDDIISRLNEKDTNYGWLFYKKSFFGLVRKNIDPYLSLNENEVSNNAVIVAKRVKEINTPDGRA